MLNDKNINVRINLGETVLNIITNNNTNSANYYRILENLFDDKDSEFRYKFAAKIKDFSIIKNMTIHVINCIEKILQNKK